MWNRCADEASRHKSLQIALQKVMFPGIRPISSQLRVKNMEEQVVLVVQMVRELAQTARGVGSSLTQCYSFLCVCLLLKNKFHLFTEIIKFGHI